MAFHGSISMTILGLNGSKTIEEKKPQKVKPSKNFSTISKNTAFYNPNASTEEIEVIAMNVLAFPKINLDIKEEENISRKYSLSEEDLLNQFDQLANQVLKNTPITVKILEKFTEITNESSQEEDEDKEDPLKLLIRDRYHT